MEENKSGSHIKLEGASNWNVWKFQSIILLRSHDLLEVVQGTKVKPETPADIQKWEKLDAKAQTWLVTRMSESAMMHILTCTTAAQMWNKLASVYEQKSETTIHIVQQRFFQYKFEDGTEMSSFLSKIEEMKNQLKQMGENISEKFVITKVLMSLPDCYKHFVSAWESAPDDKQTYDNLVARLLIEEERMKERKEVNVSSQSTSSAFVAKKIDKKDVKCYKCNNKGHFQSECRNKRNNNSEENKWGKKCFYCKKMGHLKTECWFKKNKDKESNAFVAVGANEQFQKAQWIVDTGASNHMCRDRYLFTEYTPSFSNKSVIVGNGNTCRVHGFGQMLLQVYDGDKWKDTTIENVLFVPELKTNLLSVNCITNRGYVMVTDNDKCKFIKQNKVCAVAYRQQNMYLLDVRYKHGTANVVKIQSSLKDWHEKLVHQNMQHVKNVLKNNNIVVTDDEAELKCESCLKGKIHRLPFSTSETKTSRTCELIHADTCGPFEVPSIGGSRYFIILKDDYSNYRSVYCVKGKDEAKKCIENFINKAENTTNTKVLYFRSDNGLEFVNRDVQDLFSRRGIVHQTTVPYTAEQNGKAEREIRTLTEAARTMLCAAGLPKELWAEAIMTAAYVLNRTSYSNEVGKTPYETWTNKHYDINNLKIFGTPVYVHIPKEKRRKLDSKGEKGIMVGYGENVKGYRVLFQKNNSVEVKRDVVFLERGQEEKEQVVQLDYDIDTPESTSEDQMASCESEQPPGQVVASPNVSTDTVESDSSTYVPCTSDEGSSDEDDTNLPPRQRSTRVRKQTSFYKCHHVSSEVTEPKTYKEAMSRKDASEWQKAINRELQTLKDNKTWEVCEKPACEKTEPFCMER